MCGIAGFIAGCGAADARLLAPGEGTARRVWFWVRQAAYYRKK